MAAALNKTRIRDSKLVLVLAAILVLFSQPLDATHGVLAGALDILGNVLVSLCALGRLYCTAFLGGHKNQSLITHGPFSVTRNPLYVCSFLGACGIGIISNHVVLMVLLPLAFLVVYYSLIKREEAFLTAHFGEEYRAYCARVPRFVADFRLYSVPETVTMHPKFIHRGLKDSLMWLLVLPFFELVEHLKMVGILPTLLHLP